MVICGLLLAGIVGSNPTGCMDICLLWFLCDARPLRRYDSATRGFLPSAMCLSVISKTQQWAGVGTNMVVVTHKTNVKIYSTFISVINQIDAHTYRCGDTRGCVMQFWPPDDEHMCSKHIEAWNKLVAKQKFCASSWLITEIYILRCTVSET